MNVRPDTPTVVAIAGTGRSGSTLLDRLLGGFGPCVSCGEVEYLWQRGLLNGERCGCGRPAHECPFWRSVLELAFGPARPQALASAALEFLEPVNRNRHIRTLLRGGLRSERQAVSALWLTPLYRAIAQTSGSDVVVDSSKHPSYVTLLALTEGLDVRLLHIVRDARAVSHAWSRPKARPEIGDGTTLMPRFSMLKSTTDWLSYNAYFERLGQRLGEDRYLRVRYEDLAQQPWRTLERVRTWLGLEHGPLSGGSFDLPAGHTVSGNPMRFQTGPLDIRPDEAWQREMSPLARLSVGLMTYPLQRRYGYR
ncbi:sulfotransferase [Marinivivus vitaminiproducens]|uniref:sulfotransferase n=1 Tax=Marinivivus vitaminiproducens TaxID=3035935 RepID=UPI0027A21CE4|nr:sulfotransferase [Geminicoccaceae bacterium SCSIO 64248]